jgi:carbonic anhydrase
MQLVWEHLHSNIEIIIFYIHRYALELHMVHHDKRYESLARAAQEKNGIAVIGILFHVTTTAHPIVEKFLENSQTVFGAAGKNITYGEKLLLSEWLPKNKKTFFRYEGSLTTPGCGEAVVWTVFEQSIGISVAQVKF